MSLEILSPGLLTTVQDLGRPGYRHLGIAGSGAADPLALRLANLLIGNQESAAGLEVTLAGPRLRLGAGAKEVLIALSGAELPAEVVDAAAGTHAVAMHRPLRLFAGSTLKLGSCRRGARAYLAVSGGIAVPAVLGSRSTDLGGGFGGHYGRALKKGDVLPLGEAPPLAPLPAAWQVRTIDAAGILRIMPGTHAGCLCDAARQALFGAAPDAVWQVSADVSRMGARLRGPVFHGGQATLLSEPVTAGTVQLPPDGVPILLGVEGPTTGGYPRIAQVVSADLPRLGQLRPGDMVRFRVVSLEEAHAARAEQEKWLAGVALALALRRAEHAGKKREGDATSGGS